MGTLKDGVVFDMVLVYARFCLLQRNNRVVGRQMGFAVALWLTLVLPGASPLLDWVCGCESGWCDRNMTEIDGDATLGDGYAVNVSVFLLAVSGVVTPVKITERRYMA